MSWLDRRECIGLDPAIFFPDTGNYRVAKAVCASCPVASECLSYALDNGETQGMWGGLTPRQRRGLYRVRRRPQVAGCGSDGGYYRHLRYDGTEPCGPCREAHAAAWRERKRRARRVAA